jgi:sporulation protein YlmC with PRC-barrel domain
MSESGVDLGRVVDIEFEPQTGALSSLCFTPHGDTATGEDELYDVARDDIVSITEKMVIVRHSVVARMDQELPSEAVSDRGQLMGQEPANSRETAADESAAPGLVPAARSVQSEPSSVD